VVHVGHTGETINAYKVLVREPEMKKPLGRTRRRWEGKISLDLKETGF
jgi:hypothetical protein